MNAGLVVDHHGLAAHAGRVAMIGDRVLTTASTGRAVRPGPDAYGNMCSLVPELLGALQDVLTGAVAAQAAALQETATLLRAAADGYVAADDRRARAFDGIGVRQ